MRNTKAGEVLKAEWFGRNVSVLLVNDKSVTGEVAEVSPNYVVLSTDKGEMQIMKNSIILVRPVDGGGDG